MHLPYVKEESIQNLTVFFFWLGRGNILDSKLQI